MKKMLLSLLLSAFTILLANAQGTIFSEEIEIPVGYQPQQIVLPPSPLTTQVIFVGGVDLVQTTKTYGNEASQQFAKEWHDFIGFTPDATGASLGWVSVNHEMVYRDDRVGDGGGMTVFRVKRDVNGNLEIVEQTLEDGRKGKFFNVDFVNTVGETGMNCGGIVGPDGRIWTAEEWFQGSNRSVNTASMSGPTDSGSYPKGPGGASSANRANQGVRDTADFVIKSDIPGFDGITIKKFENFNWMVEIDPRQAKAIRKQYNWGKQGFEAGSITNDNKTVYLGVDATPAFWGKFEADVAGDFTKGKLFVYKASNPQGQRWVQIDNGSIDKMLNFDAQALAVGATMYNRIEWTAIDRKTGKIYWTETGADGLGPLWSDDAANGGTYDPYHIARATAKGLTGPGDANYKDYYGRVWVYDPATNYNSVLIEGGPDWDQSTSPTEANYPKKHLSNPDGLQVIEIDGKSFAVIEEDLNGISFGRMPAGASRPVCEAWLLDLSIDNPTVDDL
ncbi:MAG: DUF839 domain-containing protein, partial [Saprospiraceae bacterium]|nr:DUF839 domain-containing protein [Saprospiraceae bacterium]